MNKFYYSFTILSLLYTENAFSSDDKSLSFSISQSIFNYIKTDQKSEPKGGEESTNNQSSLSTMDTSLEVSISWEKFLLYYYPSNADSAFALGYLISDQVEIGSYLSIESSKSDFPDSKSTENQLGVYGVFYLPVAENMLEFSATFDQVTSKQTFNSPVSSEVKTEYSAFNMSVGVNYVAAIYKGLSYVGGVSLGSAATEDEKPTKGKTTDSWVNYNIMTLRVEF